MFPCWFYILQFDVDSKPQMSHQLPQTLSHTWVFMYIFNHEKEDNVVIAFKYLLTLAVNKLVLGMELCIRNLLFVVSSVIKP